MRRMIKSRAQKTKPFCAGDNQEEHQAGRGNSQTHSISYGEAILLHVEVYEL